MPLGEEPLGRLAATEDFVRHDRREPEIGRERVDEDGRHLVERLGDVDLVVEHRGVDDAFDAAFEEVGDGLFADAVVAVGVDHQEHAVGLARPRLRALDQVVREGGGRDLVGQEPEELGTSGADVARRERRSVAEALHDGRDLGAGRRGHVRVPVQHARYRADADTGGARDVMDGRLLLGHLRPHSLLELIPMELIPRS
jgi:Arc/MetJ family transcription regulator